MDPFPGAAGKKGSGLNVYSRSTSAKNKSFRRKHAPAAAVCVRPLPINKKNNRGIQPERLGYFRPSLQRHNDEDGFPSGAIYNRRRRPANPANIYH
jgi:hypothetical protein